MRVTIKGLRRWVVAAAVLLLAVVTGFFIYGRCRFRHIEKDLPGRLGINIQATANGFTFSQASGGHTLFTLKAARQVQMKSGHVLLHDVDITLYGPPGSGRSDRIYGNDFDYDQNTETATSQGEVNIELEGMGSAQPAANASGASTAQSSTIRVRTRGLTFAQKTGDAATEQPVEFQLPRAAGTAVGANYNSKTGVLVLDSQVKITTSSNGKSAVVNAAHATLLRDQMQGLLTDATMEYETEDGSADSATLYFRKDGTTERIDASGHVRMRTDTGATMASQTANILMDEKSQPTQAELRGGVEFASTRGNDTMQGTAGEGTLHFAALTGAGGKTQTALRHAEFRRDVHFTDAVTGLGKDARGRAEKEVDGQKADVEFAPPGPSGAMEARSAVADGNPVVTMKQMPSKGPATTTRISGDHLVATLGPGNVLRQLDGTGHTRIADDSTDGARDTAQGDTLHATFAQEAVSAKAGAPPAAGRTAKKGPHSGPAEPRTETTIDTAIEDGHVVLTEKAANHPSAPTTGAPGAPAPGSTTMPATLRGWADHTEYHAGTHVLHLSGHPRIADGESMQLAAETITYHRDTQDASASGSVKATYTEPAKTTGEGATPTMGGNGPVHVIAERAEMHHATSVSDFYGSVREPARMWQDADLLTAPLIEIDRTKNVLKAGADAAALQRASMAESAGGDAVVHANLTSAMGAKHQQSVARVASQTLVYSDEKRQADFRGAVSVEQGTETIRSDDELVYLKPAPAGGKKEANAQGNSQIDHLVATGHVTITEPGRKGDGEKLVYTADSGKYMLTGTPEKRPRLWDSVHGTTTGVVLLFNSQDDSVEVSGGKSSAVTNTRSPK
ncbi:MAG TPA: LptA/OstA family protein [Acidobacteriaceae bacterium]|nr:LptA/OstA family protein [Acidobacteriaceae bacterium]